MYIETPRMMIRDFTPEDAADLHEILGDAETMENCEPACNTGIFEDFYIEPVFRGKGIARMLAQAAQNWSKENGLASLTVTCAPCDEGMYQALGFDAVLGTTFAHII